VLIELESTAITFSRNSASIGVIDDGVFVLQPFDRRISHQSSQIIVNGRRGIIDPE